MKFLNLFLSFFFLSCLSCNQDTALVESTQLFEEYYVRFLQAEKELKAHASFFEGDSIQNAKPKIFFGGVAFQGGGMQMRNLPKGVVRYSSTLEKADFISPFKFRYKNDLGETIIEKIEMQGIDDFFIKGDISQSQGMTLSLNTELSDKESLVLLFSDEQNRAASIQIDGPSELLEHVINKEQTQRLQVGKGMLYLVKKQVNYREEKNRQISSTIEFYSKTIEIEVKE